MSCPTAQHSCPGCATSQPFALLLRPVAVPLSYRLLHGSRKFILEPSQGIGDIPVKRAENQPVLVAEGCVEIASREACCFKQVRTRCALISARPEYAHGAHYRGIGIKGTGAPARHSGGGLISHNENVYRSVFKFNICLRRSLTRKTVYSKARGCDQHLSAFSCAQLPDVQASSKRRPRHRSRTTSRGPLCDHISSTNRADLAREQHGVNTLPEFLSLSLSTESRCSGSPSRMLVIQEPQIPC